MGSRLLFPFGTDFGYRRAVLPILAIVLPIFALIFVGWLSGRTGVLGPGAVQEINRFVVWLALPTLLFDIIAHAQWADIWQPAFILASGGGMAAIFVVTIALRWRRPLHLADAVVDGLNAAYPNAAFLGFPVTLALLGRASLPLTTIASLLTVCLLFAAAIILIEFSLSEAKGVRPIMGRVLLSLARNPLLVAPVLGAVVAAGGIVIPAPIETFLKMLGGATSPCALVAIGLFLVHQQGGTGTVDRRAVALIVTLKLAVQPALTWLIADRLLGLDPFLTTAAVLLAALPTGTGPFMLAQFYTREGATTSRAILISTILSIVAIPVWLSVLH